MNRFVTRRLADSYQAELVRAARMGLDFDPLTGEPAAWNLPEPATVTWYQEATAYAVMKWPSPGRPLPRQRGRGAGHGHARADPVRCTWPA